MQSQIESGEQADLSFLYLRNRSPLPGKVPFPTAAKKGVAPSSRKRLHFFAWMWRNLNEKQSDEEGCCVTIWKYLHLIEWLVVAAVSLCLFITISIASLRHKQVFSFSLWSWELSLLLVLGSRIVCNSLVRAILCLLHIPFRSFHRFLYVVYHVRHSVTITLMAWLVVSVWELQLGKLQMVLKDPVMKGIEKGLFTIGVVGSICAVKSVVAKYLAAWFYVRTYHGKVVECLFYRYLLEVLSAPPFIEISSYLPHSAVLSFADLNPLQLPSWKTKKMMIGKMRGVAAEIKTESDARSEAEKIFQKVASDSSPFIGLEDLERFLPNDDALKTLEIFRVTYEDDENIQINLLSLQEWMVHSFKRDRCLRLSVKDMDAASKTIGTIFNIVFGILLVAFSIPLLGWAGTKYTVFFASSSFAITYLFGLVWKELFYSMQLLYIRHPFDVGDEVEIGEVEMYVEKLKVTETIFMGRNKKVHICGNFGLCDKLVKNNSRSELPAWKMEAIV